MIKRFIDLFEKHKEELRKYIENHEQYLYSDSYKSLFNLVANICFEGNIDTEEIQEIDFGDYQGTLILVFHEDVYQPSSYDTFYTVIEYGSCETCDTLLGIRDYGDGTPTKRQANDYMKLCLEMVQEIKSFAKGWADV